VNAARCSSANRRGLRCAKRARLGAATCGWHSDRERHYGPVVDGDVELCGPCVPPTAVIADWVVDVLFRTLVGLDQTTYWIVDTAAGVVWLTDPPDALAADATGPFVIASVKT
jgi:hypothetical protein